MNLTRYLSFKLIWRAIVTVACLWHVTNISWEFFTFPTKVNKLIEGPADNIRSSHPRVAFSFCYREIDYYTTAALLEMSDQGIDAYLKKTDHFRAFELQRYLEEWDAWLQWDAKQIGWKNDYFIMSQKMLSLLRNYISIRPQNQTGLVREFWRKMKQELKPIFLRPKSKKIAPLPYLIDFIWNQLNVSESDAFLVQALHNYTLKHGEPGTWKRSIWATHETYEKTTKYGLHYSINSTSSKFRVTNWIYNHAMKNSLRHYAWSHRLNQRFVCHTHYYEKQFGSRGSYNLISAENQRMALAMFKTSFLVHRNLSLAKIALKNNPEDWIPNDETLAALDFKPYEWEQVRALGIMATLKGWNDYANFHLAYRKTHLPHVSLVVHPSKSLPTEWDILNGIWYVTDSSIAQRINLPQGKLNCS